MRYRSPCVVTHYVSTFRDFGSSSNLRDKFVGPTFCPIILFHIGQNWFCQTRKKHSISMAKVPVCWALYLVKGVQNDPTYKFTFHRLCHFKICSHMFDIFCIWRHLHCMTCLIESEYMFRHNRMFCWQFSKRKFCICNFGIIIVFMQQLHIPVFNLII